ncbi:ATP-binding cassette domain-containing protein [Candidatus Microgenomates bacterium CPR3]|nr:ATP-binding cassette domain-containing protein [Candidatus Microgenomates bacterium CPR3]
MIKSKVPSIKLLNEQELPVKKQEATMAELQEPLVHFDISKLKVGKKAEPGDVGQNGIVMQLTDVNKYFRVGDQDIHILKDVNATIKEMEFCIIFGPSGSGKSTMLHTLLGLEPPTSGNVFLMRSDMAQMDADTAAVFRTTRIGMVYQQPNWVKSLTVIENVAFPMYLLGYGDRGG